MSDFDNNDDFDSFDDNDFDDFKSENSLKDAWNNSPMMKIFVIVAGVVLLIAAIMIFSGSDEAEESRATAAPDQREILGGEITQNYAEVLEEVNEQRLETAVQTGRSNIPMLINPEEQDLLTSSEELPPYQDFDPLASFRANAVREEAEEEPVLVAPEEVFVQQAQPSIPAPNPEAVQALAQAMSGAASSILGNHTLSAGRIITVTPDDYYEQLAAAQLANNADSSLSAPQFVDTDGDGIAETLLNNSFASTESEVIETILIPAGTINYAQLLIEANSDTPGPILAQLVSGPLQGSRLIGSFSTATDTLSLAFTSIIIDGVTFSINAIAIDPNTTLPGLATEVNNRYFQRVLLPAAARFLEGVGSAIAEDTQTTVTVSGDTVIEEQDALDFEQELGRGVEEAFTEVADFMDDEADDVQPLIRVSKGTPLGIFFTEAVTETQ